MSEYVKVRMLANVTGFFGRPYDIGDVLNLEAAHAESLVKNGYAVYVEPTTDDGPRTATVAPAERTTAGPQRGRTTKVVTTKEEAGR